MERLTFSTFKFYLIVKRLNSKFRKSYLKKDELKSFLFYYYLCYINKI